MGAGAGAGGRRRPGPPKRRGGKAPFDAGFLDEVKAQARAMWQKPEPERGADVAVGVWVTFEEAVLGAEGKRFEFDYDQACASCRGKGMLPATAIVCNVCDGFGTVAARASLRARVPPGAKHNLKLRLEGKGNAGKAGGADGDAIITLKVPGASPCGRLSRQGDDIFSAVAVADLSVDSVVTVETVDGGKGELKVAAGTAPGTLLKIRGRGAPVFKGDGQVRRGRPAGRLRLTHPHPRGPGAAWADSEANRSAGTTMFASANAPTRPLAGPLLEGELRVSAGSAGRGKGRRARWG